LFPLVSSSFFIFRVFQKINDPKPVIASVT
jgi:hypothetical protein